MTELERIPVIGDIVIPAQISDPHLKLGVVIDIHDWGYDPQAEVHVVELQVTWNTGNIHAHYEWELEVIDVET